MAIAPRHSADGHTWHHQDRPLVGWVLDGVPVGQTVPEFKGKMPESDVRAAIAYFKPFWPNENGVINFQRWIIAASSHA